MSSTRRRRIGAVCTILLAAQLAACSGGGDSSPSSSTPPPAGNNPPTNPPTNPPVDPPTNPPTNPPSDPPTNPPTNPPTDPPTDPPSDPDTVAVTLTGTVTDAPIANAVVTATVGTETFTATADANGNYSLPIEVTETDAGAFVTLTARGVGAQSYVEFTSLAGSFQSLLSAAGDDATLSSSENFATQITNVSTAEAVFLQQANGGQPITSDGALQTLSSQVNAQDVLDLAAAIKLVVDDPTNYSMPAGETSILELASNPTARQSFINDVYDQDPSAFAAAQLAIAQDPDLAQPVNPTELGSFTTALMSTDAGFTFNYTGRILHFDLNPDGTGFAMSETFDQPFTWEVDGSTLRVTYNTPVETVSYDTEVCNGNPRQVEAHYVSEGVSVTFLNSRTVTITTVSDVTYADCPSLPPRVDTDTVARTVLTPEFLQPIDAAELAGNTQTLYVYDAAQDTVVADVADLNADGTGTTRLLGLDFTWSVDDEIGRLVQVEFSDGSHAEYGVFRDIDNFVSDIYWEVRTPNDGPVYTGAGASVFADPEYAVDVSAEAVPGRYYQFGIGDETSANASLKGFRLRFDADFMGAHEYDLVAENGTVSVDDETVHSYNGFRWAIEGDSIVVRRTWDTVAQVETCEVGAANCMVYDERRIVPLAMDGARIYWVEQRQFNNQTGVTNATPATRLVRFYDYEPLTAPATLGNQKMRLQLPPSKQRELLRGSQLR
jgi:hypothetical protein